MTTTALRGVRAYRRFALGSSFTKAVYDRLLVALIVGVGVGAMGLAMGPMWIALGETIAEVVEQFPENLMAIAGNADMATAPGWYTGEMYSIVVPFAVMFVAALSAARAFGGEVENRTIGLVMATPTRRTRLALDKAVAMIVHVIVAAGLTGLLVWVGIVISDVPVSAAGVFAITLMLTLVSCAVGGLAMVVSIISGRGNLAVLVAMLVAVIAYAWSGFVPLADPIAEFAWLSPWHHYIATDPMGSGIDWASAAWLAILAIVPLVAGVYLFKRRDIPA